MRRNRFSKGWSNIFSAQAAPFQPVAKKDPVVLIPHEFRTRAERISQKGSYADDDISPFRVLLASSVYFRIGHLVGACSTEVSWTGFVHIRPTGEFYIYDVICPQQTGRHVTFDVDAKKKNDSFFEDARAQEWSAAEVDQRLSDHIFHGHSHVDMGTKASSIDEQYVASVMKYCNVNLFLRGIANKSGRLELDLFWKELDLVIRDVPWRSELTEYEEALKWARRMVGERVDTSSPYAQTTPASSQVQGKSDSAPTNDSASQDTHTQLHKLPDVPTAEEVASDDPVVETESVCEPVPPSVKEHSIRESAVKAADDEATGEEKPGAGAMDRD